MSNSVYVLTSLRCSLHMASLYTFTDFMDSLFNYIMAISQGNFSSFYLFESIYFYLHILGRANQSISLSIFDKFCLNDLNVGSCRGFFIACDQFKEVSSCHPSSTSYLDMVGSGPNLQGTVTVLRGRIFLCTRLFKNFCCHFLILSTFHAGSSVLL